MTPNGVLKALGVMRGKLGRSRFCGAGVKDYAVGGLFNYDTGRNLREMA